MTRGVVSAENMLAGAELRARRQLAKLTQAEIAEKAKIDRSRYNALETGNYPITPTYAERIARVLHVKDPAALLPQPPAKAELPVSQSPLDLLHELAATVDDLQTTNDALVKRVEALERAASTRRRASGGR